MPLIVLLLAAAPTTLVDARTAVPELQVDLRYSTTNNFLGRDVYGDRTVCELQNDAVTMLGVADRALRASHPELRLHAWDCARPHSVQVAMWDIVKGTSKQGYVADPAGGSIHNFGCAIDLTLATTAGAVLDMGTPFDHFGPEAEPRREREMLVAGTLTATQYANRLVLREVMVRAGFLPLEHEWWHFDCATGPVARKRYPMTP